MRKVIAGFVTVSMLVLGLSFPVFADSTHGGDASATAISGSSSSATAGASASVGVNNTNVGINSQSQGQKQGQAQFQGQGQVQGQNNAQTISPAQSTNIKVDAPLVPGVAVAPGLAAGGSQVCLGSFSVGLSGPMAGVAFGKTVVDRGCERRQNAILLWNMGYRAEALHLLLLDEDVAQLFDVVKFDSVKDVAPSAAPSPESIRTAPRTEVQGG